MVHFMYKCAWTLPLVDRDASPLRSELPCRGSPCYNNSLWRRHALSTQRMSRYGSVMTRFELCSVWLPYCFGRTNEISFRWTFASLVRISSSRWAEAASFLPRSVLDCRWLMSFGASLAEFSLQPWSNHTPNHPEAFRSQLRRAPNRSHLIP
ncbi:uncharacterized protein EI90DRAFT_640773 [Cantharellus anzutake]|uniref:uncharacterized protein n=1 Tax=Cantharellus anzutake TaxID=1750568 RepID=UPI001902E543|nr:uncharacterized protein EI90DRAFT_640773 [Cantharellus anzutake]KAF8333206.1 hypothetical protein EI90DRAFT_640773 [Cantharellus anzutake]